MYFLRQLKRVKYNSNLTSSYFMSKVLCINLIQRTLIKGKKDCLAPMIETPFKNY